MRKLALATAAAAALMFSAPAFTTPALAQGADVKVKINSGERDHVRKKVVIRRGGDMERRKVVIRSGDRGRHEGWRNRDEKRVTIRSDRGRHEGWRHRDSGMTKKVIIKRGEGGSKTVIKKFD
jgi:hypothetical protein